MNQNHFSKVGEAGSDSCETHFHGSMKQDISGELKSRDRNIGSRASNAPA
jgi:hypothetical protein